MAWLLTESVLVAGKNLPAVGSFAACESGDSEEGMLLHNSDVFLFTADDVLRGTNISCLYEQHHKTNFIFPVSYTVFSEEKCA